MNWRITLRRVWKITLKRLSNDDEFYGTEIYKTVYFFNSLYFQRLILQDLKLTVLQLYLVNVVLSYWSKSKSHTSKSLGQCEQEVQKMFTF